MTQSEALAILESGQSVLLTGAAGTGKTYLLNQFIRRARADGKNVAVTATTGLAATHLNGTTIHAWSGMGVRDHLDGMFFHKLSKQRADIIGNANILIIDEISMLHDFRLDIIEEITRTIRGGDRPFGGLQVILCGDFFQLPPVNRSEGRQGSFISDSKIWRNGTFGVCYLEEHYRHADDDAFARILNGIRAGQLTRSQIDLLQAKTQIADNPGDTRTRLLTTNINVDEINHQRLDELEQEEISFEMETSGRKQYVESLIKSCLAPQTLRLKRGAVVMCIKNSPDKKYQNGSLGVVEDFEPYTNYPIVKLLNGREVSIKPETWELLDGDKRRATLTQLPLRLAWAITVHKSQGMTLDSAQIDLRNAFVEGMGYVALSRVRDLKSLVLDGMNGMALRTSPIARDLDMVFRTMSDDLLNQSAGIITQWQAQEKLRDAHKAAPKSKTAAVNWSDKLMKMREQYPNAYKPWHEKEDIKLIKLFAAENGVSSLSKLLGRHPGSIRARLKKHFGEDIVVKK